MSGGGKGHIVTRAINSAARAMSRRQLPQYTVPAASEIKNFHLTKLRNVLRGRSDSSNPRWLTRTPRVEMLEEVALMWLIPTHNTGGKRSGRLGGSTCGELTILLMSLESGSDCRNHQAGPNTSGIVSDWQ